MLTRLAFSSSSALPGVLQHIAQQQPNKLRDGALFSVSTTRQRAAFVLGVTEVKMLLRSGRVVQEVFVLGRRPDGPSVNTVASVNTRHRMIHVRPPWLTMRNCKRR